MSRSQLKEWVTFQKLKWAHQAKQRLAARGGEKRSRTERSANFASPGDFDVGFGGRAGRAGRGAATIGGFLRRAQRTLLDSPWQIVHVVETGTPGRKFIRFKF